MLVLLFWRSKEKIKNEGSSPIEEWNRRRREYCERVRDFKHGEVPFCNGGPNLMEIFEMIDKGTPYGRCEKYREVYERILKIETPKLDEEYLFELMEQYEKEIRESKK